MAEAIVENSLEYLGHVTGRHFDSVYDKVLGKPKALTIQTKEVSNDDNYSSPPREKKPRRHSESYSAYERDRVRLPSEVGHYTYTLREAQRVNRPPVKQLKALPSTEPVGSKLTEWNLRQQEELSNKQLEAYRSERDDPPRALESVLPKKDLILLRKVRRDSAMASGYRDDYRESGYRGGGGENDRPRQQKDRYYSDEDSDYDERTGDRRRGGGRGYDDDDYDTVRETREVYRGPAANRPPRELERTQSGRSDYSDRYGSGAVAQYSRGSEGREVDTYDRREKSRGRDRSRSRSRSISPGRSGSRSRAGSGIRGKLEDTFSTSTHGLAAGLAGAVIGGLAGREFGQKHKQRDIIIGAVAGGLVANAGETKWRQYKEKKERDVEDDYYDGKQRIEQRYEGRSRSRGR